MPKQISKKSASKKRSQNTNSSSSCPIGSHWVRTHPMTFPPSKKNPGGVTTRRAHCARNPASSKVSFSPQEIKKIATTDAFRSKKKPCDLKFRFGDGNTYDELIAGWTDYWNKVFEPDEPLDPNLVKALIASESGFRKLLLAVPKNSLSARGLMQILDATRVILGDRKGEIKDYHFDVSREDLNDPSTNICAGIRWLFYKQKRATAKIGRAATWEEAVAEYKSLSRNLKSKNVKKKAEAQKTLDIFKEFYKKYQKCKK